MNSTSNVHMSLPRGAARAIPMLLALTALLLTMVTPFVGRAGATLPGSSFDATDAVVDVGGNIVQLPDVCGDADDDGPINGASTKLNVIHTDVPPTINPNARHPPHSDLCTIWVGSEITPGPDPQFLVYLAWERAAAGGSSGAYWEFQKEELPCATTAEDCNPYAGRSPGDFLVHFDFQGNSLDDVTLRFFDGTQFGDGINPGDFLPDPAGEASVHEDRLFGEAVLNLTELGVLDPSGPECTAFAGLIPGSATGNSDQSDFKDIVLTDANPTLTNCGHVEVVKDVVGEDDHGQAFPITLADGDQLDRTEELGHGDSFSQLDVLRGDGYAVSEDVPDGWSLVGIECLAEDGSDAGPADGFTVIAGETTTCTVTNAPQLPELTVVKDVVNDDGGTASAATFPVTVNDLEVELSPAEGDTAQVVLLDLAPGDYTVAEGETGGYELVSVVCEGSGEVSEDLATITLGLGDSGTCTVTNDDLPVGIEVTKVADQASVVFDPDSTEPQVVTYTYTVTNTGETPLGDLSLVDDMLGDITLDGDTLAVGGTLVGTATHTVTQADSDAGAIENVASVTGTSPDGRTVVDDDDEVVTVTEVAGVVIEKPPVVPAPPPAPVLSATGFDAIGLAIMSAVMAALGLALLVLTPAGVAARGRRKD